jgi:hypothetical protein
MDVLVGGTAGATLAYRLPTYLVSIRVRRIQGAVEVSRESFDEADVVLSGRLCAMTKLEFLQHDFA